MVNTFDPTEVPNEFATSFAPTPKARKKAMMKPAIKIHKTSSGIGEPLQSIVERLGRQNTIMTKSNKIKCD